MVLTDYREFCARTLCVCVVVVCVGGGGMRSYCVRRRYLPKDWWHATANIDDCVGIGGHMHTVADDVRI